MNEILRTQQIQEKWALGESEISRATGIAKHKVRALLAGYEQILTEDEAQALEDLRAFLARAAQIGDDPVAWLEDPLVNGHTVTGWDLYEEGETEALLDIIGGEPADEVLDDTIRDWRTRFTKLYDAWEDEPETTALGYR